MERVPFTPQRTCDCPLSRFGCAGAITHRSSCSKHGTEWLAQSGEPITPGKRYRWISGDDDWSRERGYPEINVVAEVTWISDQGMVFALWSESSETCIPNSAVVELVES